jgi:hypothetical protein
MGKYADFFTFGNERWLDIAHVRFEGRGPKLARVERLRWRTPFEESNDHQQGSFGDESARLDSFGIGDSGEIGVKAGGFRVAAELNEIGGVGGDDAGDSVLDELLGQVRESDQGRERYFWLHHPEFG